MKKKLSNKTLSRWILTLLMMVTGTTQSVAQNVTIDLIHGSLLAAVTDENETGFAQGYRSLWRHEQLALSMTGTDRDGLTNGEVLEPSAVFGQRNGKITIVGGRRPSYIVVSLPKGYRITGYTLVLANDLVGDNSNVGTGDFASINDNDEPLNQGQTATMRFYETKMWPDNETNSGHSSRADCNSSGYNEDQVRYIELGTNWQNGQIGQTASDILATATADDGDTDINPSDVNKKYTISRTSQSEDDMGNQIYFRLVKNYCFYGLTIESFEITFTAEGTFTANVKPTEASDIAVSVDSAAFKTNKIDIGEMTNHTQPGTNNTAFTYTWGEVENLDAFNYIYQDDAYGMNTELGGNVPKEGVAATKNISKVNNGGDYWYGLKNDIYYVEPPIQIKNKAGNMVPIGYRIVGAKINYALGSEDYYIRLYDRTGEKITTADSLIAVNSSNATGSKDLGILNNDAIKFEILRKNANGELIPFSENGVALITVDLYLQALDPYIDKMDIVCHDDRDVLQLTQTFTADNFSVAGDRFIFYVPADYGNEDLTFTFSGLYSKYGDETYYDGGNGAARYSFVRSPYFIDVDGNEDGGLYNNTAYDPNHSYEDKVYTVDAGKYRFKFNNAEDLAKAGHATTGYLTEYPFSVKKYLETKNPGDSTAYYPIAPSDSLGKFIPCVLNASKQNQKTGTYYVFTADETRWNIAPTDGWQHRYYAFYRMEIELIAKTFTPELKWTKIYNNTLYNDGTGDDKEDSMWGLTLDVAEENGQKVTGYLTYQEILDHIQGREGVRYKDQAECDSVNATLHGAIAAGAFLTAEEATAVNNVCGTSYTAGQEIAANHANAYNATLAGHVTTSDWKISPIDKSLDDDNLTAPASMKQILYVDGTPLYAMLNSSQNSVYKTLNDLKAELNPNALVFLPENTTSTLVNVAYEKPSTSSTRGLQAGKDIVLTDKYPFYTPYDIQVDAANSATYTRVLTQPDYNQVTNATIMLPFTLKLDEEGLHTNDDGKCSFTVNTMETGAQMATVGKSTVNYGTAYFKPLTGSTEANKPYMIKVVSIDESASEGNTISFIASQKGSSIVKTPDFATMPTGKSEISNETEPIFSGEFIMGETAQAKYNDVNYDFTNYASYSGGKFDRAVSEKVFYFWQNKYVDLRTLYPSTQRYLMSYPFRGVYTYEASAVGAKMNGFYISYDLDEMESAGFTTGLEGLGTKADMMIRSGRGFITITATTDQKFAIRTLNGMIFKNVSVSGGNTTTVSLPAGIYIVNNTKITVK